MNLGDAIHGGALRPSKEMNPGAHWKRDKDAGIWRPVIEWPRCADYGGGGFRQSRGGGRFREGGERRGAGVER